jgi:hypothetical protein
MATLLEQGIIAVKTNQKEEAKRLLTQFIKQNPGHEQAWLWLSEVVDTLGEQIECIEQVLKINPDNATAKLALRKLKAQPTRSTAAAQPSGAYGPNMAGSANMPDQNQARRPFRLSESSWPEANVFALHHQPTSMVAPVRSNNGYGLLKGRPPQQPVSRPVQRPSAQRQPARPEQTEGVPILPVILFGTLSVTAIGGIVMIIALIFFNN